MQPNKTKLALIMGTLLYSASHSTYATIADFPVTVTMRDDVTLTELQSVDFGQNIFTAAAGNCLLDASAPDPGDVFANVVVGGTYEQLSGTACADGTVAQAGLYKIVSEEAVAITVTITKPLFTAGDDFDFTPAGCLPSFSGDNTSLDTCKVLVEGVGIDTAGPATADVGGSNTVVATETIMSIGGTINVMNVLTAGQIYNAKQFHVNVVYK
jgi:hypothetical protein